MANNVVLQCLFTHQYNTDKPFISESVIGSSYASCDGGNSSNGKYRRKYFSKSSSLIVGKNKFNKLKRQIKYKNLKYPKQDLIFTMNSEQCSEPEISLKTSTPYSVSTTYIIDSEVATETSYVIKKSKSSVTTNILPPFYTEYIVGNVCRKCKSKECKDPYKNPTVRARIYECQLKVAEERRPCSCDSDIHFEVMKGLYECYKNKDCGNCNCILCGHLPCDNIDITRDHGRGETFLKGTPNSNQHNIKNALGYTADHGLPLPKGRTKSQKKLIQEVIERRNKKIKALEDLVEKGTGCGTCKVPDCINPLLNPAVRATLLKCQMRSADASCCCACKSGIIYKVMKGMYDCYKSKDSENCKCILCGHLPCEGLGGTSNSGKDFLTVDKIPLSEKPKIVKENLLQCLSLIATNGMYLPKGRTESEKELIDKAEDNAIEDLLKSGEPLTASVKLKIEKRNEIKKHHIGITPEPIDKIEKTKTVPKEADKSAVALLDGKTLAQKEKITRSLERKGVDLAEGKKTSQKQLTETIQLESHSETAETENAKIQEKKFAKKNKEGVSQSVSSLTYEDKKLKDKEKLQPGRSVSDTLLETKTRKVKAKVLEKNTEKKLDKKDRMDSSQSVPFLDKKEKVPNLDSFIETKSKKVKAKELKENTKKKLDKKDRKYLSRSVPDKVLDNEEKAPKEISVPTFEELRNKSLKQKEKILKALANQYLPLPEPRSKSERQLYQKVIKETAPRSFSALEGKTPEEKEKILKNLANNHVPLPEPKTKSEKKLVAKIYREIPTPTFSEFKHKQPEEKGQLLKHNAKHNIQLPKAKTSSEKKLVEKIVTEIPPSTMAAIKDRTPSEKEMILKTMAKHNIPLPEPQSASEKKIIDRVLREVPPPPPPPSKIDFKRKSPKEGKKQTAASSYEETKSFTPSKERKIVEKPAKALEKTLKEEKRSKLDETEVKSKQSQEKLAKDTTPRTFSDLEGKSPKEMEKIQKNMALPKLTVPQTKSQERLIDKINKQIPPSSHHDKDTESFTPSKERKIVREGAKALEKTSKEERKLGKLEAMVGQQSEEKFVKDMIPRTFSVLEGKSPKEKEKILKNMAMQKIPLPVPQTKSQERLIGKINKQIPHHVKETESLKSRKRMKSSGTEVNLRPKMEKQNIIRVPQTKSQERLIGKINKQIPHHVKETESLKLRKRVKSSGTEVNLSLKMEKQNIIRSKAQQHIPLAEPKTSSEKKMIEKLFKGGGKIVCECKDSDMEASKKLKVAEDLSPKPRASEVLKKAPKTKSRRAAKKPKITDVDAAKKLEVAEDLSPKLRSSEVLMKKSLKTKSSLTTKKPKRKPRTCNQACGCDLLEPQFRESVIRIHVTSPDISALCPCPGEPPCIAPHILSGVSVNENNDIVLTVRMAVGAPSYTYKSDGVKCQTSSTKTAHKTLLSPTYYNEVFPQNIYEFYGLRNISNKIHGASSRECVSSTVVNSNILNDSLDKLFDVAQFKSIRNVSTFLKKTISMSSLDFLYSNVNYCKYKYPEYLDQSFEQQTGCIQSSTKLDTVFKNKEQLAVFKLFSFRNRLKRKVKNKTNVDILDESDVNEHWRKDDLPNSDKTLPSTHKADKHSDKIEKKIDTNEIPEKTKSSTRSPENIDKDTSETVVAVNNYMEYPETKLSNIKIEIESKGNTTEVEENSENKQFKDEQNGCGDHIIDNDCYLKETNNNVSSVMLLIPMDAQDSENSLNTCSSLMLLHLSENFSDRYSSRNISVHAVNIDVQASRSRSLARRCDSSWVRSGTEDAYNCSTPILYSAARGRSKNHKLSVQWSDTSYACNYGMDCGNVRPMHQDYPQSNDIYERSSSRRVRPSPPGFTITRLPKSSREYQQREYQREYSDWNNEQSKGNQMYDDRGRLACSGCFSSGHLPQAPPCKKVLEHRDSSPEKRESKLSKLNVFRGKKWGTKSDTKMQDTSTSTHSYMVFARDEATYCQNTPPTSQIFNRTKSKKITIQSKCNLFRGKKLWGAKSASKLQDSFTSTHSYMVYGHDQATLCRNIPAITKEDIDTQTIGKTRSKLNKYCNKSATKLSTYYNRSTSKLSNCYDESATKLSKHYKEHREKRKSDPKMQDCVTCTHSYAVFGKDQGTLCQVMDNVELSSSTCVTTGPPYLRIAWKASNDATDMERKHLNIWRGIYKDILNTNINETQSPICRSEENFHCIKTSTIRQKGDLPSFHRVGDTEPHEFVGYWESSGQSCTILPPRPKPQSVIVALRCGSNHCQTDSVNQLYQQVCSKKPCHQPYERAYEKPRKEVKTNEDCSWGGAMIIENDCNKNRRRALNTNHKGTNLECSVGSVRQLAQRKPHDGAPRKCEPKMNDRGEYVCTPCPAPAKKPLHRPQMNDCSHQTSPEHTRPPNQRMQPSCDPISDACGCPAEQMNCEPKINACGEYACTPCPAAEKKPPHRPQINDCGRQSRPEYTRPPNQRIQQPCDRRVDAAEQTKKSTGRRMICEPKLNIPSHHKWTTCTPQMKSCGQQSQQISPEYTRTPCPRIQPDPKLNVRGDHVCPAAEKRLPCKPKTSVCGPQRPLEYTLPPCPGLQPFHSIRDPCGYQAEQTMQSPCRIIEPSCFRTPVRNLSGPSLTKCKPKGLPECWGPRSPPGSLYRVCGTRITPQCEEQSPWTTGWSRDVPDCSCEANTPRMPCPERTPIGGGLKPPISKLRNKPSRTQEMKIQEVASEVTSGFEMLLGLDVVKHNAQYYERMKCDGIPVERKISLKAACSFLLSPFRRSVECSCEEEKPKENKGFKMKIDAKGSAVLPCNIGSLHLLCLRNKKGSATENEVPSRVKSMRTESRGSPVPVPSIGSEPSIISRILSRVMSKKSLTETAPLTSQVEAVAETSQPISSEPSRKSRILSRIMNKNPEESTTETSPSISPEPSRKSRILSRIMSTKPEESTPETTPPISPEPSKKSRILSRIMSKKPEVPATETTPPISPEPSKKSRILSRIMSKKPEEPATETTPPISAEPSKKSRILSRIMSKKPEEPATETTPPISAEPSKKSRILSRIMSKKPEVPPTETTPPIAEPSKKSKILSKVMSKKPEPAAEATPPISAEPSKKSRILSNIMSKKPEEPPVEPAPPVTPQPSKKSKILSRIMSKKPEEPPPELPAPVPSKKSKILSRIMSKKPEESPPETPPPEPSKKSKILSKVISKKPEESPPETPPPEPSKKSKVPSKVMSKKPEESPPETPPPEPSKKSKVPSKVISKKPVESPPETPPPEPSKKSKVPSKVMSKKLEESPPETPPPVPSKKSKIPSKAVSGKPEEPPAEPALAPQPSKKSKVPSRVTSKPPVAEPPPPPPPPPIEEAPPPEPEIVEEVYPYGTTVEEFEVPYGTVIETEETTITTYI